ncbi:MAG: flagellar protein FlgN [Deltaproteobacteria bacterium]|nr:flagellar protein FlgN [Deltaproteobacteria bacterium]
MITLDISQEESVKKDCDFEKLVDSLLSVLAKEIEVYEELQAIVQKERGTLARPSLELISDINSKKETCILKARMLEEVRANIVKKIAGHLGREEKEINISFLASQVGGRQRTALKARQKILLTLVGAIKETNKMNRELLDYSLSYVRNSVNFINQIMCSGADYANTGKLKTGSRRGIMLCKEG